LEVFVKIAVGSDSITGLTKVISEYLETKGIDLIRCGALAEKEADYVDAAEEVAESVSKGDSDQGLIFCNTGTGVTIIANKIPGVRAALCPDGYSAKIAKLANNANVLVLGMRLTGEMHAKEIVDTWLETAPSTEERRVNFHRKTDEVDRRYRSPDLE
jgi:ribose 5-phosphate isomerase B